MKHAKANNVYIYIEDNYGKLLLSVSDDGKGFDISRKITGVGITNIKSRSELFNGRVELTSEPGNGTSLSVIFNTEDLYP